MRDPLTRGIHGIHCLTGSTDSSARYEQAEQAGFETYMTKPVDPSQAARRDPAKRMKEPAAVEASGLSLADARDVLDYWENAGYGDLKADYEEGKGFTVPGVRPPFEAVPYKPAASKGVGQCPCSRCGPAALYTNSRITGPSTTCCGRPVGS